jgi:hypothetical protein
MTAVMRNVALYAQASNRPRCPPIATSSGVKSSVVAMLANGAIAPTQMRYGCCSIIVQFRNNGMSPNQRSSTILNHSHSNINGAAKCLSCLAFRRVALLDTVRNTVKATTSSSDAGFQAI